MTIPKAYRSKFADADVAHAYVDEFLNVSIATQIKVLREQREMTQQQLADAAGMKQERISVLENVNYSSWSINPLRKLARALGVRLKVSFETFGSYFPEFNNFSREDLQRQSRAEEIEAGNVDNIIDLARSQGRFIEQTAPKTKNQLPITPEVGGQSTPVRSTPSTQVVARIKDASDPTQIRRN